MKTKEFIVGNFTISVPLEHVRQVISGNLLNPIHGYPGLIGFFPNKELDVIPVFSIDEDYVNDLNNCRILVFEGKTSIGLKIDGIGEKKDSIKKIITYEDMIRKWID